MAIKTGWVHQREFAPSRVAWIIDGMSRRTQEAVAAAKGNRPFRYSSDIVAEDLIYAIRGQKRDTFIYVCTRKVVEIHFGTIVGNHADLRVRVQNPDDTWFEEHHVVTLDQYHFAQAGMAEVEALIAAKHSALRTQNSELRTEGAQS